MRKEKEKGNVVKVFAMIVLTSTNMKDEIQSRFDDAIENGTDELDVYMEMLEAGINVPMVRKYMGNSVADTMQNFCEKHGLI